MDRAAPKIAFKDACPMPGEITVYSLRIGPSKQTDVMAHLSFYDSGKLGKLPFVESRAPQMNRRRS